MSARHRRIATPREMEQQLARVDELSGKLRQQYRWGHEIVYGIAKGGDVSGRAGPSDPTGNNAVGREVARRAVTSCSHSVRDALGNLEAALEQVERAFAGRTPAPEPYAKVPAITKTEFAESLEAKHRRAQRGEGYGAA